MLQPELAWKSEPSWAWWGIIGNSSRGLHVLCNFYMNIYLEMVSYKKGKQVALTWAEAKDAFQTLKRACPEAPMLPFAGFNKPFLQETDASKLGLRGCVITKTSLMSQYHQISYSSQSLTTHECYYHSMKQEFLALKAQEYLLWKSFIVKTNKNPVTYIMSTLNLECHQTPMVEWLAWFMFSIKHQEGHYNAAAGVLSHVTSKVDAETVKSILDGVTVGTMERADAHDPAVSPGWWRNPQAIPVNCNSGSSCTHRPTCDWLGDHSTGGSSTQGGNWVDL